MSRLIVEKLSIASPGGDCLVDDCSFTIAAGTAHTLVGESGAGKSLICVAVAGTIDPALQVTGRIVLDGRSLLDLAPAARRALWSQSMFLLPQEPKPALAQVRTVRSQIADMARLFQAKSRRNAGLEADRLLTMLGLDADLDGNKRPWQLSGGMAQRVAFAIALGAPAPLIIVDEPTKGMDMQRRRDILDALLLLLDDGRSLLVVTHDLTFARLMPGTMTVMHRGASIEQGPSQAIFSNARQPYTRSLLAADPCNWTARPFAATRAETARLDAVCVRAGATGPRLASNVNLSVPAGGIVGLVGPSGSGKTTVGDTLLKLKRPESGSVMWMKGGRRRHYQKLYQEPGAPFSPWRKVAATLADAIVMQGCSRSDLERTAKPLLARVGLSPALLMRFPGQLSGGELQRLGIVRALLCDPLFLFADEPTSRLDLLTQKLIIELLIGLTEERSMGTLLVSHDGELVAKASNSVFDLTSHAIARGGVRDEPPRRIGKLYAQG